MKRIGNLFKDICDIENLQLADTKARKGKRNTRGVVKHDKEQDLNILKIHESLINKTYKTSQNIIHIVQLLMLRKTKLKNTLIN